MIQIDENMKRLFILEQFYEQVVKLIEDGNTGNTVGAMVDLYAYETTQKLIEVSEES